MVRKLLRRSRRKNKSMREIVLTPIMELVAAHVDGVTGDTVVATSRLPKRPLTDPIVDDGTMNALYYLELAGIGPDEDHEQELKCEFDPEFCSPKIVGIRLPDSLTDNQSLEQNHAILLEFAHPTNRPNVATKRDIDRYILFTEYVGDVMVGHWIADGQVLEIQVLEIDTDKAKSLKDLTQGYCRLRCAYQIKMKLSLKRKTRRLEAVLRQLQWLTTLVFESSLPDCITCDCHPEALHDVGVAHFYGSLEYPETCNSSSSQLLPVKQDLVLAQEELEKALTGGSWDAGKYLAIISTMFTDDEKSTSGGLANLAIGLYHLAAAAGRKDAYAILARRYAAGDGVSRALDISVYHYHHAAADASVAYHERGKQPLHEMNRLYDGLKEDLTKGQLGDDDELTQFQKLRAEQGDVNAMAEMGDLCYWGARGVAIRWYSRASAEGVADGAYNVGHMYEYGIGVPVNLERAERYYRCVLVLASGSMEASVVVRTALMRLRIRKWLLQTPFAGLASRGGVASQLPVTTHFENSSLQFSELDGFIDLGKIWTGWSRIPIFTVGATIVVAAVGFMYMRRSD
ncbi:hypothetical protein FI667_g12536, partial [Globisporangium splendens]